MNDKTGWQFFGGWQFFALGSAFFAGLTAVLGKAGVVSINSNLATFIRTAVILVMMAAIVTFRNEWEPLDKLSGRAVLLLTLSAFATGMSWLCYFRALQGGPVSAVAPIDKLSVAFVILFSVLFLGEPLTWRTMLGGGLVICGALTLATS